MNARRRFLTLLAAATTLGIAACTSDVSNPLSPVGATSAARRPSRDQNPPPPLPGDPTFVQASPDAPSIANPVVSFWAHENSGSGAKIFYHAAPGSIDSTAFVDFRVDGGSLAFYPDGRPFAEGDSVLVTITVVDPVRLIIDCQPSGLRFSASKPARLKMSYAHTDASTSPTASLLMIWRRDSVADPWTAQTSKVELGIAEVRTDVTGFSGYAIAY